MQGDDSFLVGSGPAMEGTWFNPQTGDSFTVRDTYIEGDEFYIITTDGRRFNSDLISQYIQGEPGSMPRGIKPEVDVNQPRPSNFTAGLDADMQAEIDEALRPQNRPAILNPLDQPLPSSQPAVAAKPMDEDELLINRMLSRGEAPKVKVSVDWKKYPSKQMEMLTDFMGVPVEKICNYYIDKLDLNEIRDQIQNEICEFISRKQSGEEEKPTKKKN